MGGTGDPYMVPPESSACGQIRQFLDDLQITIPNGVSKTPEEIGKIAEDLARQLALNPDRDFLGEQVKKARSGSKDGS